MESETSPRTNFTFQYLEGKKFLYFNGKETQDYLMKWSMKNRLKIQAFSYDQPFQSYQKDEFLLAFMQDSNVINNLKVLSSSDKWVSLGTKAKTVTAKQLPCSALSMSYFDKLYDDGIVKESGSIVKCFDEYHPDFTVSDELRKMLIMEDSDNYELYSAAEKDEFLFQLFRHVCLGGELCQYEDNIEPYLETTKLIYKDLVAVQKDSKTGKLVVTSIVLQITASDDRGLIYPDCQEHKQNFAYLIIDPFKHHVNVLYHKFGTSWNDE